MGIMQMMMSGGGAAMEATGGDSVVTTTIDGTSYKVHTFLDDGTFTVTAEGSIDALLVGAGGGGGHYGGGGGGGCVIHVQSKPLTAGSYSIVVGDGGDYTGRSEGQIIDSDNDGESTTFNGYTATGGGAGGAYNSQAARAGANAGGSGAYITSTVDGVAPSSVDAYDTVYAGYTGGAFVYAANNYPGGGGAGAGEDGSTGADGDGYGHGGDGVQINIDGNNYYWGGGGNYSNDAGGNGGNGGGGGGSDIGNNLGAGGSGINSGSDASNGNGGDGGTNTGGGGGGGSWDAGPGGTCGDGGSGIVIIRYEA